MACKKEKYRNITELVQCLNVQDLLRQAIYREYKNNKSIYGISPITHYMDKESGKLYIIAEYEIQNKKTKKIRPISLFAFGLFVLNISEDNVNLTLIYDKIVGRSYTKFSRIEKERKYIKYIEKMAFYSTDEIFGSTIQTMMSLDITYIYNYSKEGAYLKSYNHNRQSLFFKELHESHFDNTIMKYIVNELYYTADNLLIVNYKREDRDNESSTKNGNNEIAFSKFCLLLTDICIVRKMPIIRSYNS